ncbi:MAG: acyl-CoA dehydrogenase family protein [Novosphingobium sp.]
MEFSTDPAEEAFRAEMQAFLKANLPADLAERGRRHYTATREEMLRWQSILYEHGYGQPHWAVEHGGKGWTGRQRMIFDQELAKAHAPVTNVQGLALFGPVLNAFGTPDQQARFRDPLLSGKVVWCQGFSEPGSGSDLASLRTSAVRQGDNWVINGQKIWTTQANLADWVFLLARTSSEGKKQEGITFFLIDMKSPGISVRPIISIDGQHHLNETFFDEVVVPDANVIGAPGQGWSIAKFLLNNERLFGSADMPALFMSLERVRDIAGRRLVDGRPLIEDREFAARLARLDFDIAAIEMKMIETIARGQMTEQDLSIVGSAIKVRATEVYMKLTQLAVEALGDAGALSFPDPDGAEAIDPAPAPHYAEGVAVAYFYSRAAAIYGGTNEIQRNIIAKAKFGF